MDADNEKSLAPLAATATLSLKPLSQDASVVVRNPLVPLVGVIVADGIGSHFGSELASAASCAALSRSLESLGSDDRLLITELFEGVRSTLATELADKVAALPEGVSAADAFGTTLLCGIALPETLWLAYVGNGAIFHIRGDFTEFPASRLLPWTSLNYLNPHARAAEGTNALYKWLSPTAQPAQATPTVVSVSRDREVCGDILVVCTDGIYSYDQTPVGLDSEQRAWISGEESMRLLYAELSAFFRGADLSDTALQATLEQYLIKLRDHDLVTDDCTIGVVISETALRYHDALRTRHQMEPS